MLTAEDRQRGARAAAATNRQVADAFAAEVAPQVLAFRREGKSLRQVAAALDALGVRPPLGLRWSAEQVRRVLARASATPTNPSAGAPTNTSACDAAGGHASPQKKEAVAIDTPPTPAEALLAAAIAAGVVLGLDGDQVTMADCEAARELLPAIAEHEAALVELLRRPAT